MTKTELQETLDAMKKYGGSFVNSLADCIKQADSSNQAKLFRAFPEYIEQYRKLAEKDKSSKLEKKHE